MTFCFYTFLLVKFCSWSLLEIFLSSNCIAHYGKTCYHVPVMGRGDVIDTFSGSHDHPGVTNEKKEKEWYSLFFMALSVEH